MRLHLVARILVCCVCVKPCMFNRRVHNGQPTMGDRRFMVYLVQSELSSIKYDSWLCGGSLVSPNQILTAAACLVEMDHLYVIAGYRRYVSSYDLKDDECTKRTMRKIVKTCVPKAYNFSYSDEVKWKYLDIGIAVVDKPYDSVDMTFKIYCSYLPAPIIINYNPVFIRPGLSTVLYGWGSTNNMRHPEDILDPNAEFLQEASVTITDAKLCKKYHNTTGMAGLIDKYIICTWGKGLLDGEGQLREVKSTAIQDIDGCKRRFWDAENNTKCLDYVYDFRRSNKSETESQEGNETAFDPRYTQTRRQVLCQNDHGGPLVGWVGSKEMLLGVAISSRIRNSDFMCLWPNIFTSASCASKIIYCLLSHLPNTRSKCAETVYEEGFDILESKYDWKNRTVHVRGPEDEMELHIRPQEPINHLNSNYK